MKSQHSKNPIMHIQPLLYAVTLSLALTACGDKSAQNNAAAPKKPLPVTLLEVQPTTIPISIESVAQTEGAKEVEVRPRVGGILLKRLYQEGAPIKEGAAMFLIDPVPYQIALSQAKAQLAEQQAKIEQSQREEARLKDLLSTKSVSQREYDEAVSTTAISKATLQQAESNVKQAELNLSYTTVVAPNSGVSGRFQFSEGALINANTSLLTTIVQVNPIWVRFSLSDNEIALIPGGKISKSTIQEVDVVLPNGDVYPEKGHINFAASQIDPKLGTLQLRAEFANKDNQILPGQFVRARILSGKHDGVFLVPQSAVLQSDQGRYVYVLSDQGTAVMRPIVAGEWSGTDWVILKGLNGGDKVITDNLIKLRPDAPVVDKETQKTSSQPVAAVTVKS